MRPTPSKAAHHDQLRSWICDNVDILNKHFYNEVVCQQDSFQYDHKDLAGQHARRTSGRFSFWVKGAFGDNSGHGAKERSLRRTRTIDTQAVVHGFLIGFQELSFSFLLVWSGWVEVYKAKRMKFSLSRTHPAVEVGARRDALSCTAL